VTTVFFLSFFFLSFWNECTIDWSTKKAAGKKFFFDFSWQPILGRWRYFD
jgi:hypothetical protein